METITREEFLEELENVMNEKDIEQLKINMDAEEPKDLIQDKGSANYFIGLIKKKQDEIAKINEYCDQEIKRLTDNLNQYREEMIKPIQNSINFFSNGLEVFMRKYNDETNKKTLKLPNGNLSIKKVQPKFIYDDELLIPWLNANAPEYVQTTQEQKVIKTGLKKNGDIVDGTLIIDGKEVDGISIVHQESKFEIK